MNYDVVSRLLKPKKLWNRSEVLAKTCPIPKEPGIYAWYFKTAPRGVPTEGCFVHGSMVLLYIGISPKSPPKNGLPPSRENLCKRIRYHMRGNACGSTLRLTLGCLLEEDLKIQLRRVGSGKRRTFASGEERLSEWMSENAFVTWVACPEPWNHEKQIIPCVSPPLNLKDNSNNPFSSILSEIRKNAKCRADNMPVILGKITQ